MPEYLFDIRDGGPARDEIRAEYANPDEMRRAARKLLPDIARHEINDCEMNYSVAVSVRDARGEAIFSATLSFSEDRAPG